MVLHAARNAPGASQKFQSLHERASTRLADDDETDIFVDLLPPLECHSTVVFIMIRSSAELESDDVHIRCVRDVSRHQSLFAAKFVGDAASCAWWFGDILTVLTLLWMIVGVLKQE